MLVFSLSLLRPPARGIVVAAACLTAPVGVQADSLYRCRDEGGIVRWQQRPCAAAPAEAVVSLPVTTHGAQNPRRDTPPPLADPATQQALAALAQRQNELEARQRQLREELDQALASLSPAPRLEREGALSERERLATARAEWELRKERERRYRAELRLIEKQLEGIARERQALLRGR